MLVSLEPSRRVRNTDDESGAPDISLLKITDNSDEGTP